MVFEQNMGMFHTQGQSELYMVPDKKHEKKLQKSLAQLNIWIMIYLQIQ